MNDRDLMESKKKQFGNLRRRPFDSSTHRANNEEVSDGAQKLGSCKRKMDRTNYSYDSLKCKSLVMERAEDVRANLAAEFPSFLKLMLYSNVSRGFCMNLPSGFCRKYLPREDATLILAGEGGKEYSINFLACRMQFSGGWKRFSVDHSLVEGDVLVFHLVDHSKFKVYIVKANDFTEVDGALGLLSLFSHQKQKAIKHAKAGRPKPLLRDNDQGNRQSNGPVLFDIDDKHEDCSSENEEGISSCLGSSHDSKDLSGSKFNILGSRLNKESVLSEQFCQWQKFCLHDNFLINTNGTLASEIISEIVNLADAMRACKLPTPLANCSSHLKALNGSEQLAMDVGFLCTRLQRLGSLTFESKLAAIFKRYKALILEQAIVEEEVKTLELKLSTLKGKLKLLNCKMKALEVSAGKYQVMFRKEVEAPW